MRAPSSTITANYRGIAAERARAIADTYSAGMRADAKGTWRLMDKILILDFGGQSTQLIGRRIRQLGVYSEIVPGDASAETVDFRDVRGIILSGSPFSVYEDGAPRADIRMYTRGLPLLGICYGFQRMSADHGGTVAPLGSKEYGRARITLKEKSALFARVPGDSFVSWMSHGDSVTEAPEGFRVIGRSENGLAAAFADETRRMWGVQFHPEASHCEHGHGNPRGFRRRHLPGEVRMEHASRFSEAKGSC